MVRIAASLIALLYFLNSAAAQTPPTQPIPAKPLGKRQTTQAAPAVGSPCDFGVVVTAGDEFTVLTTGLTIYQKKTMTIPIPGWGLKDLIFARTRAAIPSGVSILRIPYSRRNSLPATSRRTR